MSSWQLCFPLLADTVLSSVADLLWWLELTPLQSHALKSLSVILFINLILIFVSWHVYAHRISHTLSFSKSVYHMLFEVCFWNRVVNVADESCIWLAFLILQHVASRVIGNSLLNIFLSITDSLRIVEDILKKNTNFKLPKDNSARIWYIKVCGENNIRPQKNKGVTVQGTEWHGKKISCGKEW